MRLPAVLAVIIACLSFVSAAQGQAPQELWRSPSGSILTLVEQGGATVSFVVQTFSSAAETAGGRVGQTAFTGERNGSSFSGTIYQLEGGCRWPNPARGIMQPSGQEIVFTARRVTNYQVGNCTPNTFDQVTFSYTRVTPAPSQASAGPPRERTVPTATAATLPSFGAVSSTQDGAGFAVFDFACSANGERAPSISRSETTYYDFRGATQAERLQVCDPSNRADCNSYQLYRYDIMCRGGVVNAAQLAVATRTPSDNYPLELRDGRLYAVFWKNREIPSGASMGFPGQKPLIDIPSFKYEKVRTGELAFPPGAGPAAQPRLQALAQIRPNPTITVHGDPNPRAPTLAPLSATMTLLDTVFAWLKGIAVALVAFYGFVVLRSFKASKPRYVSSPTIAAAFCGIAIIALLLAPNPVVRPEVVQAQVDAQLAAIRNERAAIRRDEATLKSLVSMREGRFEPITQSNLNRINELARPRTLPTLTNPDPGGFWMTLCLILLLPAGAFLLRYPWRFAIGAQYLFSRHPAASHIAVPGSGAPVANPRGLGAALMANAAWVLNTPSRVFINIRKEKAGAIADALEADVRITEKAEKLARAAAARTRAETALEEAQRELEAERRKAKNR